ncbi:MAG: acyltransferase [Sulfurovum sp. AS07-7]|nr:MAG: acyltransferase [Sulfurovum sp. AS07-7]
MRLNIDSFLLHHYPWLSNLPKIFQDIIFGFLKYFFHEKEINGFLNINSQKDSFGFVEAVIDHFNIKSVFSKQELERIPSFGKVIIIANHPLGALDSLALIDTIKIVRKDIKIVANSFLSKIEQLNDILIPVDNINNKIDKNSLKEIYSAMDKNMAVIIFPAGEVSKANISGIKDGKWREGFLKIALRAKAPILPIFIKAKNSKLFYLMSFFNKSISTISLPHEMFKSSHKEIVFKIGKQIPYESFSNTKLLPKQLLKLFRKHLFNLAKEKKEIFQTQNNIALAESKQELKRELKNALLLGSTFDNKQIYLYNSSKQNCVLNEIGRLREISFRFVGEGSGKKRDLDDFDFYYKHIIVWDDEALEIAGAYRIAIGSDVYRNYGIEGFYTSKLFNYEKDFNEILLNGVELGRSFVQPKYWGSRALDYLWQGIGAFVKTDPNIRYLFGAVSMSDSFNSLAKAMMIDFYMNYFKSDKKLVSHKCPYQFSDDERARCAHIFCYNDYKKDLLALKKELGIMGFAIPTLYKQYSEICEEGGVKFYDFGVDVDFGNCIDGFIVTDLSMLKEAKRNRYL